jgi:hypothetical protein
MNMQVLSERIRINNLRYSVEFMLDKFKDK